MEKDTVLLSVERYNELRDFKNETEQGKTYVITNSWGSRMNRCGYSKTYLTDDEVVADFDKRNSELADEVKELKNQLDKKDEECKKKQEPKETTLEDVKNMSWFEFRKWKNGLLNTKL